MSKSETVWTEVDVASLPKELRIAVEAEMEAGRTQKDLKAKATLLWTKFARAGKIADSDEEVAYFHKWGKTKRSIVPVKTTKAVKASADAVSL